MPDQAARFARRYTTAGGAAFMRFERDGHAVDVRVRDGRGQVERYTRREAREIAEDRLAGSPAIWVVSCPDYETEPTTRDNAERMRNEIETLRACANVHTLASRARVL